MNQDHLRIASETLKQYIAESKKEIADKRKDGTFALDSWLAEERARTKMITEAVMALHEKLGELTLLVQSGKGH